MLFRSFQNVAAIILSLLAAQTATAETLVIEHSSKVTLTSLTDGIYSRLPAHNKELALQQQINANTALSNAQFPDPLSIDLKHQNDALGSSDGLQEWESSLNMSLWLPGQKQQQSLLSDKLAAELPAYKNQLRLDASAKVRQLIWDVALAETAEKQSLQAWKTAQKLEQDVSARVKAGELAATESLLANTNALEMRSQYLVKKAELEHSLSSYRHITGETALPINYDEVLTIVTQSHHSDMKVEQDHPSLMMLDQRINTLRTRQDLAQFEGAAGTNVSVGLRRERGSRDESFNNSFGVGVSFSLDDKVYRQPAVAAASIALTDVQVARQQLERQLNISLFSALHDLETKQKQLILIKEQNDTTQRYFAMQQRAFDLGEIDLVSLLRSQLLSNESRNRMQTSEIEIKYLIALVNQALGIIL